MSFISRRSKRLAANQARHSVAAFTLACINTLIRQIRQSSTSRLEVQVHVEKPKCRCRLGCLHVLFGMARARL